MKFTLLINEDAYSRHTEKARQNLSQYEQLKKYKDNPDVYISFRSIKKIGINPRSKYDTPNGIYTYPLKAIWKEFDHKKKKINVPFAGENPYIYVIESVGKGIKDLSKYSESDLEKDIKKLKKEYSDGSSIRKEYAERITDTLDKIVKDSIYESKVKTFSGRLWYITYILSRNILSGKPANTWNLILNKTLGYNYICDKGQKIIHKHEPIQAIFFNTKCFKVLDIIDNKEKEKVKVTMSYKPPSWFNVNKNNTVKRFVKRKINNRIDMVFSGVTWESGIFKDGIWKSGTWDSGESEKAVWIKGWIYDPNKKGNFESDWSWEGDYVRSLINPKKYFPEYED